jgi:UDP-N-acetylmuramoyl-tripeptide--D-alanyl-D-alanine ligase
LTGDPLHALQVFAAHHRNQYAIPLLAITGSCGKTTSKDLVTALLSTKYSVVKTQGNLNNEIGCPLSLLNIDNDTEMAVMELGANHRGEIAGLCELARPTEAAITMISEAHLEGFGSLDDVASAKGEIAQGLPQEGTFYVNANDTNCVRIAEAFGGKTVRFGEREAAGGPNLLLGEPGDVILRSWRLDPDGEMVLDVDPVGELKLPLYARAHAANVLLAVAVGLRHGVKSFQDPLAEACAASTRLRVVQLGPIEVIDDTYNANPASVRAALDALRNRPGSGARIAVLGEMKELGADAEFWHAQVGRMAGEVGVEALFSRGPHARATIDEAKRAGVPHAEMHETHDALAGAIRACAQPGDSVLVKGSRGAAMERVIERLRLLYEDGVASPGDNNP